MPQKQDDNYSMYPHRVLVGERKLMTQTYFLKAFRQCLGKYLISPGFLRLLYKIVPDFQGHPICQTLAMKHLLLCLIGGPPVGNMVLECTWRVEDGREG